ncbi:unnamed protein product, partial [marine sediment metagenome]
DQRLIISKTEIRVEVFWNGKWGYGHTTNWNRYWGNQLPAIISALAEFLDAAQTKKLIGILEEKRFTELTKELM